MRYTIPSTMAAVALCLGAVACDKHNHSSHDGIQHETPEQAAERAKSAPVVAGQGVVEVTADERGFTPGHIQVKQGQKTTLRFKRTSDKTCATAVVFPELEIKKDLPLGQPVDIQVPTGQKRTFGFQCGMGMYKSSVVIVGS